MGSINKGVLMKGKGYGYAAAMWHSYKSNSSNCFSFPKVGLCVHHKLFKFRSCSSTITRSSLQPPDVSRLAKTAQISLTPIEVEEFGPKIQQVIDWFGQLQGVDLQSIEPSIRAETENNLRDNAPETFDHRDAMVAAVPSYEEPLIKVPKVLSMD